MKPTREEGGAAASRWKKIRGANTRIVVLIEPLHTFEDTSASGHTPAKESAGIKIGMPRILSHTNDILIPQLALSVLDRTRVVILIVMDPIADLVNGGEFEYLRTGL